MSIVILRNVIAIVGTIIILLSFILAFKLRNKKDLPSYFKFFYCIQLFALLLSISTILFTFNKIDKVTISILQNLFYTIEFLFESLFFVLLFKKTKAAAFIKIVLCVSILIITFILLNNNFSHALFPLYAIINLVIAICCILYYYQLFNIEGSFVLTTKLNIWVVTGFFICSSICFPLSAILEFMAEIINREVAYGLLTVINLSIIIKHLFFIKAYSLAAKI